MVEFIPQTISKFQKEGRKERRKGSRERGREERRREKKIFKCLNAYLKYIYIF